MTNSLEKSAAGILKELRMQRGWTRDEAAQRSGLTALIYGKLEISGSQLTVNRMISLAKVFDVPVHRLLDSSENTTFQASQTEKRLLKEKLDHYEQEVIRLQDIVIGLLDELINK